MPLTTELEKKDNGVFGQAHQTNGIYCMSKYGTHICKGHINPFMYTCADLRSDDVSV